MASLEGRQVVEVVKPKHGRPPKPRPAAQPAQEGPAAAQQEEPAVAQQEEPRGHSRMTGRRACEVYVHVHRGT